MSRSLLILLLCVGFAREARAGWGVGAHLSAVSVRGGEDKGSTGIWGAPSSVIGYQPGLRLSWGNPLHRDDLLLDVGAFAIVQGGSTVGQVLATLGYQRAFLADRALSPILNANVGFSRESGPRAKYSSLFGLGGGLRHTVADGHGALRAEVRWDQLAKDDSIGRPRLDSFGVRAGFDLWL